MLCLNKNVYILLDKTFVFELLILPNIILGSVLLSTFAYFFKVLIFQ